MSTRTKLGYKQLGLFRIISAIVSKGTYILEVLEKTRKSRTVSGTRLKAFVYRGVCINQRVKGAIRLSQNYFKGRAREIIVRGRLVIRGGEESLVSEESDKNTGIKTTIRGTNLRRKELEEQRERTRYILEGRPFVVII